MEKKNLDWANLGFGYMTTDYRYVANYKNGVWDKGGLTDDPTVTLNECAGIFHYCQEIFEGLKAYTTEDGHIVTFRPDLNAVRMMDSAKRLEMPPFPAERFLEAVEEVVKANAAWLLLTAAAQAYMFVLICLQALRLSALSPRMNISSAFW